jgi:hypothetical protein
LHIRGHCGFPRAIHHPDRIYREVKAKLEVSRGFASYERVGQVQYSRHVIAQGRRAERLHACCVTSRSVEVYILGSYARIWHTLSIPYIMVLRSVDILTLLPSRRQGDFEFANLVCVLNIKHLSRLSPSTCRMYKKLKLHLPSHLQLYLTADTRLFIDTISS